MRAFVWGFYLALVCIVCPPVGDALGEPPSANQDCSILPDNSSNIPIDHVSVLPNSRPLASPIGASAGVQADPGVVKPVVSPQETPPPNRVKVSFWQWLGSRTVDCSSGVCTFK